MMLSFISNLSISTSSWFSVCSRSSFPPPTPPRGAAPPHRSRRRRRCTARPASPSPARTGSRRRTKKRGSRVDGEPVWHREQVYRSIGLVPETEAVMHGITGWEFVVANARLHGLADPEAAARRALDIVEMTDAQDRTIATYSKGMRQRVKMAARARPRPAGAAARRALQRDGPASAAAPDGAAAQRWAPRAAPCCSARTSSKRSSRSPDRSRSWSPAARRVRRLPGDPPADDRPPAPVHVRSSDDRRWRRRLLAAEPRSRRVELRTSGGVDGPGGRLRPVRPCLPRIAREHGDPARSGHPTDESLESVFSYLVNR